jgi:hypothetical protein
MNSLDRHLRHPGEHGRLPFHPDCPVCRQRLAGSLARDGLAARQAQAAVAAGLLAVTTPPAPAPASDPTLDPDWQPPGPEGQSAPEAPEQAPPASDDGQGGAGGEERGAVESEPLAETTPEPAVLDAAPPAPAPTLSVPAEQLPAPVAEAPVPAPASEQPTAPADPVEQQPAEEPAGTQRRAKPRQRPSEQVRRAALAPQPVAAEPVVQTQLPVAAPAVPDTVAVSQPAPASDAPIEGDSYTVRPGDSLWSIAQRLLGADASNGRIAREVNRLWQLNSERIATGDPDLLHVGTELRLR